LLVVLFDFGDGVEATALLLEESLLGEESGVNVLNIVSDFSEEKVHICEIAEQPFLVASELGQLGDLGLDLLKTSFLR
jgi:hypothetical protein